MKKKGKKRHHQKKKHQHRHRHQKSRHHTKHKNKTKAENTKSDTRTQKQIPNSTNTDKINSGASTQTKDQLEITTEATVRRVANEVVKEFYRTNSHDKTWRNQTAVLRQGLNQQAEILEKVQNILRSQEERWAQEQATNSQKAIQQQKEQEEQESILRSIRDELQEVQRQQELQQAAFHQMEIAQHDQLKEHESERLVNFVSAVNAEEIRKILEEFDLPDDVELIQQTSENTSTIFVFPRTAAVKDHDINETNFQNSSITLEAKHKQFLMSRYF